MMRILSAMREACDGPYPSLTMVIAVTAGIVAALHHFGLSDAFDVVCGLFAGTVIGAYFVIRQLPWFGPEVYCDTLTTVGDQFIDAKILDRVTHDLV